LKWKGACCNLSVAGGLHLTIDSNITGFIDTYREMAERITSVRGETESDFRVFEKVLHASLIDAVARAARPLTMGNKERFVSVVEEFGGWIDANRISLPHLVALLHKVPDPSFNDVRTFANRELRNWPLGSKIKLVREPPLAQVQAIWPKDQAGKNILGRIKLEHLQHSHLLYSYRNSLVHELRTPGYAMEIIADDQPYYVSMDTLGGSAGYAQVSARSWELTYPIRFFRKLSTDLLENMERYFRANQVDPLTQYQFGSHWLPELN
jgi:hypothetical protein